jgi:putative endonuclease
VMASSAFLRAIRRAAAAVGSARTAVALPREGAGPADAAAKLYAMPEAWVYLLRCRDGSLYTGWTVDLERRLARHRTGVASRYTASRLPVELELAMPMPDRSAARREEARIKRLPRAAKLALVGAAPVTRTASDWPAPQAQ